MDFVIARSPGPIRRDDGRRIVELLSRVGCGYAQGADHHRRVRLACYLADRVAKARVVEEERRGALRPDDQVNRRQVGIGLARLWDAELGQFLDNLIEVLLRPLLAGEERNIGLHQARGAVGGQAGGFQQRARLEHQYRRHRNRQEQSSAARLHLEGHRKGHVQEQDFKGQSVHAGDRGQARQRDVIHQRGAERVPAEVEGKTAQHLRRHPNEWRQQDCLLSHPAGREQRHHPSEHRPRQRHRQAEQHQHPGRNGAVESAVDVHDVVDPITTPERPDQPAHIAQQEGLPRRSGTRNNPTLRQTRAEGWATHGLENRQQQRDNANPAQEAQIGAGEHEHLQHPGDYGEQPRAPREARSDFRRADWSAGHGCCRVHFRFTEAHALR